MERIYQNTAGRFRIVRHEQGVFQVDFKPTLGDLITYPECEGDCFMSFRAALAWIRSHGKTTNITSKLGDSGTWF